jgi:hypothetical protein
VPGYRSVLLEGVESDREVVLEEAFEVHFVLPPDVPLPESGSLRFGLTRDDDSSTTFFRGSESLGHLDGGGVRVFDERRLLTFSIARPGSHELRFDLLYSMEGATMSFGILAEEPRRLEIDESAAGATFVVRPDAKRYEKARKGL